MSFLNTIRFTDYFYNGLAAGQSQAAFNAVTQSVLSGDGVGNAATSPTALDVAGVKYNPNKEANVRPLMGQTLTPIFADAKAAGSDYFVSSYEFTRGLISGQWKLSGFEDSPWQLFDLEKDRAETMDLAAKEPKILADLVEKWNAYAAEAGNVAPSWNPPAGNERRYWLDQRKSDLIVEASPKFSDPAVPINTQITLRFAGDIDFKDAKGVGMNGKLTLMKYGQDKPVWEINPTPANLVDARTIRLKNPKLEPNSHYYTLWDANLVRVAMPNGTRPFPPMANGPFAYRFNTGAK